MKESAGRYKLTCSCATRAIAVVVLLLGIVYASDRQQLSESEPSQREFYAKEIVGDAKCLDGSKSVGCIEELYA